MYNIYVQYFGLGYQISTKVGSRLPLFSANQSVKEHQEMLGIGANENHSLDHNFAGPFSARPS